MKKFGFVLGAALMLVLAGTLETKASVIFEQITNPGGGTLFTYDLTPGAGGVSSFGGTAVALAGGGFWINCPCPATRMLSIWKLARARTVRRAI
jgi:hypothetical protein